MSGSATDTRTAVENESAPDRPRGHRMPPAPAGRATFPHCLRAEWIKIRTMRSTVHVILGTLAFCVGLASLNGTSAGGDYGNMTTADQAAFDPLAAKATVLVAIVLPVGLLVSLSGFLVGQAALAGADAPHLGLSDPQALRGNSGRWPLSDARRPVRAGDRCGDP